MAINRIKFYRMTARMSQVELARQIGKSVPALSAFENGKARPSLATLQRISQVLGCSIDELASDFPLKAAQ
ncbi:MAG: antitoxin HipB [Pelotomaculum sp. PtaB.Bin104]|nr:MAG: antitoxin HipB [Pelotomaculum sp. PtaB.Bin104]